MKIKKLYCNPFKKLPQIVIETIDGRFYKMDPGNACRITEDTLSKRPLPSFIIEQPFYVAKGNNAIEAPAYMYKVCGFEKVE